MIHSLYFMTFDQYTNLRSWNQPWPPLTMSTMKIFDECKIVSTAVLIFLPGISLARLQDLSWAVMTRV